MPSGLLGWAGRLLVGGLAAALLPLALWVAGCTGGQKESQPLSASTPGDTARPEDTATSPPTEETCNGRDDDGDGAVDEGFADADGNGVADCLQTCVSVLVAPGSSVPPNPSCVPWDGEPVEDPWNVEKRWELVTGVSPGGDPLLAGTAPIALPPSTAGGAVVLLAWDRSLAFQDARVLRASADGNSVDASNFAGWGSPPPGPAAGDLDGDGAVTLFLEDADGAVFSLDPDGTVGWRSPGPDDASAAPLVLTDLEGDGAAEVLDQAWVYDARSGVLLREVDAPPALYNGQVVAADLDLDGTQEVLLAGFVDDADGTNRWRADLHDTDCVYPVLVQADLDPEAEVAWVGAQVLVYDTDGTLLSSTRLDGHYTGPPCAGDLDGDGAMELAVATSTGLRALELDGTLLWSRPYGSIGGGGCATSDLDGDGLAEVLYAQDSFFILDGATGAVHDEDPSPPPLAGFTHPVPVDLDGDGHAEIVVVGGDPDLPGTPTIAVYGHAGSRLTQDPTPQWTPAASTWMTHDASGGERNDDGTLPADPPPTWTRYGVFRGRLAGPDAHPLGVDLSVALTDVCVASCTDGPVTVSIQVTNAGTLPAPAGTRLALRAVDADGERTVATLPLPEIGAEVALDGFTLTLTPADLGQLGLRVTVDDDGSGTTEVYECDETNNDDTWLVSPC